MRRINRISQPIAQFILLLLLFHVGLPSYAQASLVYEQELARQAKQDFKAGNYRQALNKYSRIDAKESTYTSRYNLAVCHYKLKNWQQAYSLFSGLHLQDPANEQIHLNLALSANRLGKDKEALDHFELLATIAESDVIAALAYQQLRQLTSSKQTLSIKQLKSSRWILSAAIGAGSDDNVVSPVDDGASTQSDTFFEQNLYAGWYSSVDFNNSWFIDSVWYSSQYSEISEYDVGVFGAGVRKYFSLSNKHRLHIGVRVDQSSIGGNGYLNSVYFDLGTRHKLNRLDSLRFSIRLQDSEDRNELYQGLAGTSFRVSADYWKYTGHHRWRLRYRYDQDDKNDDSGTYTDDLDNTFNTFTSYSAARHSLHASWTYEKNNWRTQFFTSYRDSQYIDPHIFVDDTSNLLNILREDQKISTGLLLSRNLSRTWSLDFEFTNTDNRSTIDQYDYNQNIVSLTLSWQN